MIISLNVKFQPFIPFPCEVIYIWTFWGILGPTAYYDVTVGVNIVSVEMVATIEFLTPELV